MSRAPLPKARSSGNKARTTGKRLLKKPNEIQAPPIIVLTVECPQTFNSGIITKNSLQPVQIEEPKLDPLQYSLLQFSDAILNGANTLNVQTGGNIEVDSTKLNTFAPVLVIQNEKNPTDARCLDNSLSLPKEAPKEQGILNNLLFSSLPKSVVCTMVPADGRRKNITTVQNPIGCNLSSSVIENISSRISPGTFNEEETINVISDKPVTCRARASLPVNFLFFGKASNQVGDSVFARIDIPNKSRFGPMEGTLVEYDPSAQYSHLLLTVESDGGSFKGLNTSNENLSNWMRYVRAAECSEQQNLILHQIGDQLFLSAVRRIRAGEELRAWYGASYARPRNLPLLGPQKKPQSIKTVRVKSGNTPGNPTSKGAVDTSEVASKWTCTDCKRSFLSATLFNLHVLTHAADNIETEGKKCDNRQAKSSAAILTAKKDPPWEAICVQCNLSFPSLSALSQHSKTHKRGKSFDCPMCGERFPKVSQFRLHIRTHLVDGGFNCTHCSKKFTEYKQIRGHMRRFHSGKNFVCLQCSKLFTTLDKLKTHQLSHSGRKDFTCVDCKRQFRRKDKLNAHVKRKCGKRSNSDSKKNDSYQKYVYNCHTCLLGFKRRGMLVNHFALRHPEITHDSVPELNVPIVLDKKDYICQHCGKVYKSASKRKAHIAKYHFDQEVLTASAIESPEKYSISYCQTVGSESKMPHNCKWCHRQYLSRAKLLQHQRKNHPENLPKSLLLPRSSKNQRGAKGQVKEEAEKVSDTNMFLGEPLELTEYELSSSGGGEYIIDGNTLKRAIKEDVLLSDCSPVGLSELSQLIESRPDGYFKVYQGTTGISVAQPVELWDPLSVCLGTSPPLHPGHLTSST